ncbi:MAG: tetratricopeptide repeat protein [Rhodocyclaceae bacterium]|nr:tetratricopeptide repeat protein [Rhodocyclaceae bacterium]
MPDHAYEVSVADFEQKVIAASHGVPVVVDFWAEWCQPCRILKPILEKLAAEYGGRFILAKVNSDENQELAVRYGVRGIPAVKAFVDGEMIDEFTGALPEGEVRAFLERLLPSPAEPLRQQALAAHRHGDNDTALDLLAQAVALDPKCEAAQLDSAEILLEAGALDDAMRILEGIAAPARNQPRADALAARLHLAANAVGADIPTLQRQLAANPADLDTQLQLGNALALGRDYRGAFGHLIEIVRRDRKWNDEAGRKTLLALFNLLGSQPEYDDLVREFRIQLSRTLN